MDTSEITANASPYELSVFRDATEAAEALAQLIARRCTEAIQARGSCRIALAGGNTPRAVYEALAKPALAGTVAWDRVQVYFGDERCVPIGDKASNAHMAKIALFSEVPIPNGNVHTIDSKLPPEQAAEAYARELGAEPLDLVLLGLGEDGHTASLFPGGEELEVSGRRVTASTSPIAPHARITLTFEALNEAREVVFMVVGPDKQARLAEVLRQAQGPLDANTLPAARVRPRLRPVKWFIDRASRGEDSGAAKSLQAADISATGLAEFGMIGLAVMGRNLALNISDHGFRVAVWNRDGDLTRRTVEESKGHLRATVSLPEFVASLERPRRIMMMIKAGSPVDAVLDTLIPLLDPEDVVIDGGNSWFEDTRRREQRLTRHGLRFFGVGVSGGEEGARYGPSLMPGGDPGGYQRIRPVMEAIAAKTDHGACVTHVGADGAGHFVKMVHNGIEYADMQFIAEAYHVLTALLGMEPPALAATFQRWNEGPLASFLVEITAQIFEQPDPVTGGWLVDAVLDKAGQKGTGKWTAEVALTLGVPVPSIAAAIDARVLSSMKRDRVAFAPQLPGPPAGASTTPITVDDVHDALFAAKVGAYAQGMALIQAGAEHYGWSIDSREIARIWTGGCIIRARFLETMMRAWEKTPNLPNLLLDETTRQEVDRRQVAWRSVVAAAVSAGLPVPGMAASLAYYDALRTARLPQNLVQAQRDAFGAHTYQRVDDPNGAAVHSEWL